MSTPRTDRPSENLLSDGGRSHRIPPAVGDLSQPLSIFNLGPAGEDERIRLVQEWLDTHEDEQLSTLLVPVSRVSLFVDGSLKILLDVASFEGTIDEGMVFDELWVSADRSRWDWR